MTIEKNDPGLTYHGGRGMWRRRKACVGASITRWVEEVEVGC